MFSNALCRETRRQNAKTTSKHFDFDNYKKYFLGTRTSYDNNLYITSSENCFSFIFVEFFLFYPFLYELSGDILKETLK